MVIIMETKGEKREVKKNKKIRNRTLQNNRKDMWLIDYCKSKRLGDVKNAS